MKTSPTSKGHYVVANHLKVLMSSLQHYPNKVSCEAIAETLDASLLEKGVVTHKKLNGINNQSRLAAFTKIILFSERLNLLFN